MPGGKLLGGEGNSQIMDVYCQKNLKWLSSQYFIG